MCREREHDQSQRKTSSPGKGCAELKEKFAPMSPLTLTTGWKTNRHPSQKKALWTRIPILVSGEGVEKILAVPIKTAKRGLRANTIHSVISEWAISIEFEHAVLRHNGDEYGI
ncbi:hypothetical protein GWK47_008614 [Chionoecetes opilio]|uniref:Uncharacterized protein n=1 Tax=Chionoecetes opilio TaxID=41210 RepID=A0A8J4Y5Z0_CHIOP|nr:hypothetical protein GWK47_008614 [Chionoecetes opilio]